MEVGASVCSPDSPMIDARTAQRLLDAAQAHIEKDHAESYHQIYEIAVAHSDDPFDPWKGVKEIAATDQTRRCEHDFKVVDCRFGSSVLPDVNILKCKKCGESSKEIMTESCVWHNNEYPCKECQLFKVSADSRQADRGELCDHGMYESENCSECVTADSHPQSGSEVSSSSEDSVGEGQCIGCGKPRSQCKCTRYELAK